MCIGAALPNWVHKAGSGNDQVQVGTWTDGKPGPEGVGTPGTWVQSGGSIPLDNGKTHASKDFWDPVKKRRIMCVFLFFFFFFAPLFYLGFGGFGEVCVCVCGGGGWV